MCERKLVFAQYEQSTIRRPFKMKDEGNENVGGGVWSGCKKGLKVFVIILLVLVVVILAIVAVDVMTSPSTGRSSKHCSPPVVDVVYSWSNGSDPRLHELFELHTGRVRNNHATAKRRVQDHGELRYSIRSVFMNAPWIRNIYIIMKGFQRFPFGKMPHDRIKLVPEEELLDPDASPVFNSQAVESRMHHIPGLSEHYLYFCDDMFVNKKMAVEDFFDPQNDWAPRVFVRRFLKTWKGDIHPDGDMHMNAWRNINRVMDGYREQNSKKPRARNYPIHQVTAMRKSWMCEAENQFSNEYKITSRSKTRASDNIVPVALAQALQVELGNAREQYVLGMRYAFIIPLTDKNWLNHSMYSLVRSYNPALLCINDFSSCTKENVDVDMTEFLSKQFPVPFPGEYKRGEEPSEEEQHEAKDVWNM